MKISFWLKRARWRLALRVMGKGNAGDVLFHFEFYREARKVLRMAQFERLDRGAKWTVKRKVDRHE